MNGTKFFQALSVSVLMVSVASAQGQRRQPILQEPLEKYDMPPAPAMRMPTSSRMIVPSGGFTSYQINVNAQGLNIVGDAANEPSMVVDPTNRDRIAVGWRQFNNVSSNFRQGGYGYTTNGGLTWTFPGVLENNVFRSDPVLDTNSAATFHYNSLQQTFFTDEFRSSNQGQSWSLLGPATGGDKQWITIDKTSSTGAGFVYQLWSTAGNNYNGRQFSRSTNGGSTWMNPINIPNSPVWGTMDVASNGDLYLSGMSQSGTSFWFERSQNAKNSAVTPTFNLAKSVSLGGDLSYGPPTNPGGLGGQVWISADRSGGATQGYIYMLCSIDRNATNPCDVMLSRSIDGGNTWSAPLRVNDDPQGQNRYHWFGTMSVAPNGRIDVCWLDTRNDASNNTSELYYTYSSDGGLTFQPNIKVSAAFNSTIGWPNQNKIGDYMACSSDNAGASIVYPATFSGGQDIYFVRVPQATSQTVLPDSFALLRGILVSGQLSDLFNADGNYVVGKAGLVMNLLEEPLQVIVDGTSPSTNPSDLSFTLVTKANATQLEQKTSLFNFQTSQYELLDTRATTLVDATVTITPTGDLSRFVNAVDHKMRTRITYRQVAPTATVWLVSLNQTVWSVTP